MASSVLSPADRTESQATSTHSSPASSERAARGPVTHGHSARELLTVAQVCCQYGIGKTTLYEAMDEGSLPAYRLRKRATRIRREDIERWIAELPPYKPKTPRPR